MMLWGAWSPKLPQKWQHLCFKPLVWMQGFWKKTVPVSTASAEPHQAHTVLGWPLLPVLLSPVIV